MSRSALVKQITVSMYSNVLVTTMTGGVMGRRWRTTSKDGGDSDSEEKSAAPRALPAHLLAPPASPQPHKTKARRPYKRPSFSSLITDDSSVAAGHRRWWPPIDDDLLDQAADKPLEHQ